MFEKHLESQTLSLVKVFKLKNTEIYFTLEYYKINEQVYNSKT